MPHPHVAEEPPARETALNGAPAPAPAQQTSSSQAVRPTTRFAPSWSRQRQQRSLTARSLQQGPSALPQSQALVSAQRFVVSTNSSSSNATGGRWKHTPQQRRHTEKADDAIEEGSSPLRGVQDVQDVETVPVLEAEADSGEDMQFPKISLPRVPLSLVRPSQWDQKRRRSPRLQEEIEEMKSSSVVGGESMDGGETEDKGSDDDLATNPEHEIHTPNPSIEHQDRSHMDMPAHTTSAVTRLFSTVQPFKRRRLFASPGLITSSPSAAFSDEEEEKRESGSSSIGDGIVDAEPSDEDDDEMKDVSSDELLEGEDQEHRDFDDSGDDDDIFLYNRWSRRHRRPQSAVGTDQRGAEQNPFQRARLFLPEMPGHRLGDEDGAGFEIDADHMNAEPGSVTRWNDWADEKQPPEDFFSPLKRTKRRRRRRPRNETAAKLMASSGVDEQFVPGGLAAELRDWLVQIKNTRDAQGSGKRSVTVDHVSTTPGIGMCLVEGRWREPSTTVNTEAGQDSASPCHLLLVGDGRLQQEGRLENPQTFRGGRAVTGDIVELAQPVWEIDIAGKTWTVASDWGSHRPLATGQSINQMDI